jgi:hypothetical protein
MRIEVKIDARSPYYGVSSVRGLWNRFIEGRNIILTFKARMSQVGYRGDLSEAYDKLILLYNSDLSHLQTIIALLGLDLARKVCAVPEASLVWKKLFVDEKSEKECFESARRTAHPPVQEDEECRASSYYD